jgi:xylan 1,4-beta-xylosidase
MRLLLIATLLLLPASLFGQQRVTINVDASQTLGPFQPIWNYFGYDEPNYTYTKNGRKLIGELASLSVSVRATAELTRRRGK